MDARLTAFETEAISTLIAGDHPVLKNLRAQLGVSRVSKREFTGVGFFTTLELPEATVPAPLAHRIVLGDAVVEMGGLAHGAGIVLFVEGGLLDVLEGFTYDEPWPDEVRNYKITAGGVLHLGGAPTDLETIDSAWVRHT